MVKSSNKNDRRDQNLLKHLGQPTVHLSGKYSPELLDAFDNRHPEGDAWSSFICPEFTSVCPKTNQPDFAQITINYIADKKMVESKSLKLYLFSFRNHGAFHEDCIQMICNDLAQLIRPRFIEVIGAFSPRGGIAIHPYVSWALKEKKYQELREYRMRYYRPKKFTSQQ